MFIQKLKHSKSPERVGGMDNYFFRVYFIFYDIFHDFKARRLHEAQIMVQRQNIHFIPGDKPDTLIHILRILISFGAWSKVIKKYMDHDRTFLSL
jgi:Mg2+/citrate symporter